MDIAGTEDVRPGGGGHAGRGEGRRARLARALALTVALPLVAGNLSACSYFLFDDDELEPQRVSALPPSEDEDYPKLSSVPEEAPLTSSRVRRLDLAQDLAADREHAVYSDETLRAQEATVPPPPAMPEAAGAGMAPPPPVTAGTQTADLRPLEEPDFGGAPLPPELDEEGDRSPILPPALPPALPEGDASLPPPPMLDDEAATGYATSPQLAAVPERPEAQQPQYQQPQYQQPGVQPPSYGGGAGQSGQYGQPPVLLQQQAVQQQIYEASQLQTMAMQQQAFAYEARRQAIEQQQLREQIINQNAWQLQTLQQQARQQLAALPQSTPVVPPMGYAGSEMPMAAPAPAPAVAPAYGYTPVPAPSYGVPAQQTAVPGLGGGAGQLVGLIYFGHGSTTLNESDRQVLRQVVNLQQQTGGRPLRVVGHASARTSITDPVKHRIANLNVSMSRANHVAEELVRMGARQDSVQIMGRADSEPVYHEFMPTGEAGNRRVEIFIE